jgi:hypothetical protein
MRRSFAEADRKTLFKQVEIAEAALSIASSP